MRLPQRFKRVPTEDPTTEEHGTDLPEYPSQPTMDRRSDEAGYFEKHGLPTEGETAYGGHNLSHPGNSSNVDDHENKNFGKRLWRSFSGALIYGWRAGLLRSFLLSLIAFIVNISIYAWLFASFKVTAGTATCLKGSCSAVRWSNTAIHAGLNIISTLVLGASTYAMQGLTAPTRKEVDVAHSKGKWLEIGTASVRNLFHVKRINILVWALLAFTSLPFHLFFNAVFFTTSQSNQYAVAVVEQSYFNNTGFIPSQNNSSPDLFDQLVSIDKCEGQPCSYDVRNISAVIELLQEVRNQSQVTQFARMEPLECIQNYTNGFMKGYSDVVVVSSRTNATDPVLYTRFPQRAISPDKTHSNGDPFHWICHDLFPANSTTLDRCSLKLAKDRFDLGKNWTVYGNPVDHCLARVAPDECELQFNLWLMLGVVVFGVIKTLTLCLMVFWRPSGHFLRTLGDAIASFLEESDPTTKDMCLVSSKKIRKRGFKTSFPPQTYTGRRGPWFQAANTTEFFSSIGISALYILILSIALVFAVDGAKGFAWSNGLGVADIQSLASFQGDDTGSSGIVPTLIIANIPQLGFSLLYILYTNIWSKLLVAREFDRHITLKKGLRVSDRPRGMQRGSRFFALPARYALPLMACSAGLHWLCSQSFFMVRIDGINAWGRVDKEDQLVRLGYSATGIVSLIALSVVMMLGTVGIATFRRLHTELGETSVSVIISAACHGEHREAEPSSRAVQWGDVSTGSSGVRHCAFTPGLSRRPMVGQEYS